MNAPLPAWRAALVVARRDIGDAITSPSLLLSAAVTALLSGGLYVVVLHSSSEAYLGTVYRNLALLLIFLTPVFTMRSVAEERHSGTFTMLRLLPVSAGSIAGGKLIALGVYLGAVLAPVVVYPITFLQVAERVAVGPLVVGYAGLVAVAVVYLAIGLAISAWAPHPFVAAFFTATVLLALWLADDLSGAMGGSASRMLAQLSPQHHVDAWATGVVPLGSVVFVVTAVALSAAAATAGIARVSSK
ncbi:MAG: gliding motility-associated transport system permease protein [Actinomycetota bacterium]|nr:gliding motility-associated transport system permease protein [Actinomycetota bacterium]